MPESDPLVGNTEDPLLRSGLRTMHLAKYLRQLASESAIYGLAGTLASLVNFFLIPVYTRVFSRHEYGILALVDVLVSLISVFVVLGLDSSAARWFYDSDDIEDRRSTIGSWFWCQLAVSVVMTVFLLLSAPAVSWLLTGSSEHANLVQIAAMALPLATLNKVAGNWLRYQRAAWIAVGYTAVTTLTTIGLVILMVVVWGQGMPGVYFGRFVATMLGALMAVALLGRWISIGAFSWARLRAMLRFGLPLIPGAVALWIMVSANRVILEKFCDAGEVGLYALATTVSGIVALATGAFQQAWGPFAFSILHDQQSERVYARVLDVYSFVVCLLCTGVALFAPLVLQLMATKDFYSAASCIAFLVFTHFFAGAQYIAVIGSSVQKRSGPLAIAVALGASANLVLDFVLIPFFGKEGAAAAAMLAYGCSVVYLFRASQKHYYIPYRWRVPIGCFLFSWCLIVLDWWLVPAGAIVSAMPVRLAMLSLFVPFGFWLGLIRWRHIRGALASTAARA